MFTASAFRSESVLKLLVTLAVGKNKSPATLAALMSGLSHPTLDANAALWRLSRTAREYPVVRGAVDALNTHVLKNTPEGKDFEKELEEFLNLYGHRETSWCAPRLGRRYSHQRPQSLPRPAELLRTRRSWPVSTAYPR